MAKGSDFLDTSAQWLKNQFANGNVLNSNAAINKFGKGGAQANFFGGAHAAHKNYQNDKDLWGAVKDAHTKTDGSANVAAIAGSFIAAGAGYRALSGGGAYRDSNGNTDIAGIPFV